MSYVVGMGIDLVEVLGLETALRRTPDLGPRLLRPAELRRPIESMAGYFAAKEALAKALGGGDLPWNDVEVVSAVSGAPRLALRGRVRLRADDLGVTHTCLSITHDGGYAAAVVLLLANHPATSESTLVSNDTGYRSAV